MVDLSTVIGIYGLTNTGSLLVHRIDYVEDKVLASINGEAPEWCEIIEDYWDGTEEMEPGFNLGSLFVPFAGVMRLGGR